MIVTLHEGSLEVVVDVTVQEIHIGTTSAGGPDPDSLDYTIEAVRITLNDGTDLAMPIDFVDALNSGDPDQAVWDGIEDDAVAAQCEAA